jgi:hypothetical protein
VKKKLRIVLLGITGKTPFAGVAWQVLHYLEGLRRLGCDVYYVEDTGEWPYDPEQNTITNDCSYTVKYISKIMAWCGLPDCWAYRSGVDGRIFGLTDSRFSRLFKQADILINLTGSTVLRDDHLCVPVRIYLETDPFLPQIEVAKDNRFTIDILSAHTHLFTFGENIGAPDCGIPLGCFNYGTTRQPVVLDWWYSNDSSCLTSKDRPFTTISSWKQSGKDIQWNGETYLWSKHLEFLKFIGLPLRTDQQLELALACNDSGVIQLLESYGWYVIDAINMSKNILSYRDYIFNSRGEFTVAKDQYVRPRSGWFSDRSACYLAAGRPVITQDTGFGKILPVGRGLFAFKAMDHILDALDQINADYDLHAHAAREIAEEYFAAERVLAHLMEHAGI